jgi:FKBP-type peptidyl-prolyl cis-trans isomerase
MLMIAMCGALVLVGCGGSESTAETQGGEPPLGPKPPIPTGPTTKKLIVNDLKEGTGEVVQKGDLVAVHFVGGIYETGDEIESAWVRNHPLGLRITTEGVLPGWAYGLPGARVGGRRELIFPATKKHAPPGSVPGDTLVYVVDVIDIE